MPPTVTATLMSFGQTRINQGMFATGEDTCKAKWRFIQFILLGNFADFEGGFVWILDETSGQGHYPFTSLLTHQNPEAGKSVFPVHWSRGVLFNFFSSHLSPPYFRNLCDILLSLQPSPSLCHNFSNSLSVF